MTLDRATTLDDLLSNLLECLDGPDAIKLALPYHQNKRLADIEVRTIAVCAGSGGSIFAKLAQPADLLVTGEMSHHEVRVAVERGQTVVCLDHSNAERGFLADVMQFNLKGAIEEEWRSRRASQKTNNERGLAREILDDPSVEVVVSQADTDPFGTLVKTA